ncbi:MAG: RNA polymerase sigma factor [Verrucomicrobia bacterium]|nr:RNA polymerase sigma factor [Verrucomicrobiota bacterium]
MAREPIVETTNAATEPADPRADVELVAAINRGAPAEFETLYYRHRDWAVNLAFRFTGDEALALDVMQEAFLYLLRKFPGFELRANLRTFLYPAVRNLSIAARRKASRCQSAPDGGDLLANLPAPDPRVVRDEDLAAVLGGLPVAQREVLLLRFVDGFSLMDIVEALDIPLGTVKSRLHYALDTLRNDPRTREWLGE